MKMINNPEDYKLNNIVFRIASSKVLENYKGVQGFVLSEVQFGTYEFSKVSKELALLYTDSAFKILLQVEQMFVRAGRVSVSSEMAYKIIKIMVDQIDYMIGVVNENKDVFNPDFINIWKDIHLPISKLVERVVEKSVGEDIVKAFQSIGGILIDSMDTVRFELYELDYIFNGGKSPFLAITELCGPVMTYLGKDLPSQRAVIYMDRLGVGNRFELKNYSDSYANFISCAERLVENGLIVTNFKKEAVDDFKTGRNIT
jgi:hypothetical protein